MTTCKYFGVRTIKREGTLKCRNCKDAKSELFKKCTIETNILMGTSIDVDDAGNSISIPPGQVSDTVLMFEDFGVIHRDGDKKDSETKIDSEPRKAVPTRVTGLAKLCRGLRAAGLGDDEIRLEVTKAYVRAGKDVKEAEGRAKNWVRYMNWDGGKKAKILQGV